MGLGATGLQLVQDAFYWRLPAPAAAAVRVRRPDSSPALADRFETAESRRMNALVFALVARSREPLAPARDPRRVRRRCCERRLARHGCCDVRRRHPDATFVEIGSNDGEQHDHLRPLILAPRLAGVMVEPVPYVFERLRGNYAARRRAWRSRTPRSADRDGEVPFYHLVDAAAEERASLPDWYDGIGSLSKEFVLGHAKHMPDLEERIVVPAGAVADVRVAVRAARARPRRPAASSTPRATDWEILRRIDFDRAPPAPRRSTSTSTSPPADRAAARAHLPRARLRDGGGGLRHVLPARRRRRAASARRGGGCGPRVPGVYVEDEPR